MPRHVERAIFVIHGVVTLAAAVVLGVLPATIPGAAGIEIGPDQYLLAYLLAAAEFGIGLLSLGAARLRDRSAIRLIAWSFAAFHAVTAALEIVYLMSEGTNSVLIGNLVIRIVATGLFVLIARVRV